MFYLTNHVEHINKCADKMRSFLALQLGVYMVTTMLYWVKITRSSY